MLRAAYMTQLQCVGVIGYRRCPAVRCALCAVIVPFTISDLRFQMWDFRLAASNAGLRESTQQRHIRQGRTSSPSSGPVGCLSNVTFRQLGLAKQRDVTLRDDRLPLRAHTIDHKHIRPDRLRMTISTPIPAMRDISRLEDHLPPAIVDAQ